jgi:hypothetical protein
MSSHTSVQQRPLSYEEKALYAQQLAYMQEVSPYITNLLGSGQTALNNQANIDWSSLYNNYTSQLSDIMDKQSSLLNGELPSAFTDAKNTYYNRTYENTLGSQLSNLAKSGVINSSRMNTTTNDLQKNLASQMSSDYSNDITQYNNLLNTRQSWLQGQVNDTANISNASTQNATNYFNAASALQSANTNALSTIANNENGRSYTTTSQSGLGSALSGLASVGSLFK